jgi:hypothetical protein
MTNLVVHAERDLSHALYRFIAESLYVSDHSVIIWVRFVAEFANPIVVSVQLLDVLSMPSQADFC